MLFSDAKWHQFYKGDFNMAGSTGERPFSDIVWFY